MNTRTVFLIESLATSGLLDRVETTSDEDLIIKLRGSMVELDSINKTIEVAKEIHDLLPNKPIPILREWVDRISNMHPSVQEGIQNLDFFKPISQSVGATFLQKFSDTQTLGISNWGSGVEKSLRGVLGSKMNSITSRVVEESYAKLNKALTKNLSTEFWYDQDIYPFVSYGSINANINIGSLDPTGAYSGDSGNQLVKYIYNNDYHIVGDYLYKSVYLELLKTTVIEPLILSLFGDRIKLVNYITPSVIAETVDNSFYAINIEEEGNTNIILVGDKNIQPSNIVNNKVIIPVKEGNE